MGGYCVHFETYFITTPIGELRVNVCSSGLHAVQQVLEADQDFAPDLSIQVQLRGEAALEPTKEHINALMFWLKSYFLNPFHIRLIRCPQICQHTIHGDAPKKIFSILKNTVYPGSLVTYVELADCVNIEEKDAWVVGGMMLENPLQLVVPCHRVVPVPGILGQSGNERKDRVRQWLLQYEGIIFEENGHFIHPTFAQF